MKTEKEYLQKIRYIYKQKVKSIGINGVNSDIHINQKEYKYKKHFS